MNKKRVYTAISMALGVLFISVICMLLTGSGLEHPKDRVLNDKKYAQMVLWAGESVNLDHKNENQIKSDKKSLKENEENQKLKNEDNKKNKADKPQNLIEAKKKQRKDVIEKVVENSKNTNSEKKGTKEITGNGSGKDGKNKTGKDKINSNSDTGGNKPEPKPNTNPDNPKEDHNPKIKTNLKDGKVYPQAYATFYVEGEDYRGVNILWPGKYQVTLNGEEPDSSVRYDYKGDEIGRNYQANLNQGENIVKVTVTDSKGNSAAQEFKVYGDKELAPDEYDQIYVFVKLNLNNIGLQGTPMTKVTARSGTSAHKIVYDFFTSQGYVVNGGNLASSYLASLAKPGITAGWSFSDRQKAALSKEYGDVSSITLNPDFLGEKNTTKDSGYKWRLNAYEDPPYSLGSYTPIEGDVIEIWWTNDGKDDYNSY